jgi:hypothetical protein
MALKNIEIRKEHLWNNTYNNEKLKNCIFLDVSSCSVKNSTDFSE